MCKGILTYSKTDHPNVTSPNETNNSLSDSFFHLGLIDLVQFIRVESSTLDTFKSAAFLTNKIADANAEKVLPSLSCRDDTPATITTQHQRMRNARLEDTDDRFGRVLPEQGHKRVFR